jgi:hypothetical protein
MQMGKSFDRAAQAIPDGVSSQQSGARWKVARDQSVGDSALESFSASGLCKGRLLRTCGMIRGLLHCRFALTVYSQDVLIEGVTVLQQNCAIHRGLVFLVGGIR